MGTITISLKDDIEQEFRAIAGTLYGGGKGHLGKALAEAVQNWIDEQKQEKIAKTGKEIMRHGSLFGKRLYEHRGDLHDR